MRRKLLNVGGEWALPLSAEQLTTINVDENDAAVLVRLVDGDPPRMVIRSAPTFTEAMETTLSEHAEVLLTLATVPSNLVYAEGEE